MSPLAGVLVAAALAAEPPATAPPAQPPAQETAVIETIEETTVGDLGGVRVPMGNVVETDYALPDGTTTRGLACALALEGGPVWVGKGAVVEVGGASWEVLSVTKEPGEHGEVTLTRRD